ncbi:MAG: beta-lactamase family protein [bacterium]|nr:beta-lactamase family protein [bacterium]
MSIGTTGSRPRNRAVRCGLPRLVAAAVAVQLAATALAPARADGTDALTTDLAGIVASYLAENPQAPGVTVWVKCPSLGLDWSHAAGLDARGDGAAPLTAGHVFRIASNTKTYVAATVLRLAEAGRLTLATPLGAQLPPDLSTLLRGDGYDLDSITIGQVLSHTAGLADHSGDDRYGEAIIADPRHRWTPAEQVRRCVELFDPLGPAPAPYRYSDTGYVLLGAVVETVTGRPLAAAVRAELDLAGLGLRRTWWEQLEPAPPGAGPRAHQHIGDHDVTDWDPSFDLHGGGGLVTDVRELGLFIRHLLKGRVLEQESSLAAMTGLGTEPYRLGLMAVDLDSHLAFGHQGFWNTFAFHLPGLDATLSGCILGHDAANGRILASRLAARLAREPAPGRP